VDRRIGGGNSVTFESGSGADHSKLTGSCIYNNDVGSKEGRGSSRARGVASSTVAARLKLFRSEEVPDEGIVRNLSHDQRLCPLLNLYSAPQHVVLARVAWRASEAILAGLEGGLCRIVHSNFGEYSFQAIG